MSFDNNVFTSIHNYSILKSIFTAITTHRDPFIDPLSHSVVSNSLRSHGLKQARTPCPSLTPGAYTNSCPLSRWCHPTILSSFVPFSSCLQTFPASGSFPMRQFSPSGGQNIGVSASISSPSSEYSGLISFRMEWLDLFAGTLKSLLQHHSWKAAILWNSALYSPTLISIHDY